MAGILASSSETTMVSGDTAADNAFGGFVTASQITLTTTPTGTDYQWSMAKPSGASGRSDLSGSTGESVAFTPDVAGYYTVVAIVDSTTTYILRISVTQTAITTSYEAIRYSPKTDTSVSAPALGAATYYSDDADLLVEKDAAGTVRALGSRLRSYTVGTLPSASTFAAGALVYVSDETDGAQPAFSDGTNWRRFTDRAVVS